jgi:hypothetical protein
MLRRQVQKDPPEHDDRDNVADSLVCAGSGRPHMKSVPPHQLSKEELAMSDDLGVHDVGVDKLGSPTNSASSAPQDVDASHKHPLEVHKPLQPIAEMLAKQTGLHDSMRQITKKLAAIAPHIEFPHMAVPRIELPPNMLPQIELPQIEFPRINWPNLISPQLRDRFDKIVESLKREIPDNLREIDVEDWARLGQISTSDRIGLTWSPRPQIVQLLLDAHDQVAREQILIDHAHDIYADSAASLASARHSEVDELIGFVQKAIAAARAGHGEAAQALATNVLETALEARLLLDVKPQRLLGQLSQPMSDEQSLRELRFLLSGCGIPSAYEHYNPKQRTPQYSRHGTVHCVNNNLYQALNTVKAIMLAASWLRFLAEDLNGTPTTTSGAAT